MLRKLLADFNELDAHDVANVWAIQRLIANNGNFAAIVPEISGSIPRAILKLASAAASPTFSVTEIEALEAQLFGCSRVVANAERNLGDLSARVRTARQELAPECKSARQLAEGEAVHLDELAMRADEVLRQAREYVEAIRQEQSHWYSPIVNYWKVLIDLGEVITGTALLDKDFDLKRSVDSLLGSVGLSDAIPDALKDNIVLIEAERNSISDRRKKLEKLESWLALVSKLDETLVQASAEMAAIVSFWMVLDQKVQTTAGSLRKSKQATNQNITDLHRAAARTALMQLLDYASTLDIFADTGP